MVTNDRSGRGLVPHTFLASGRRLYRAPRGYARIGWEEPAPPGTVVLTASGEFDSECAGCLREALADAGRAASVCTFLDVSRVTFGDSSFLYELLTAHGSHPRLVLVGPLPSQLRRLFEITGTHRLFHFATDRAGAGLP
ncbi:STAS domain-containing protein [Streptomyces sp. NPDC126503]|uniref:STAS domain-containing protein n=1 Tax=Streptomyces sp. NPDC126503 TaxID=3155315 RepID=UPI003327303E